MTGLEASAVVGLGAAGGRAAAPVPAWRLDRRPAFFGISTILFAAAAAATFAASSSMAAMGGIPMPGGWTMSATWLPICGPTWTGMAASFLGMWVPMTAAMMLPSLAPGLWRYGEALQRAGDARPDRSIVLASLGYFGVWAAIGGAVFPLGAALAAAAMREPALARAAPHAAGMVLLAAGGLQFTAWKARHLARCRAAPACGDASPTGAFAAFRYGLRLGCHCGCSCAGPTAVLLVFGMTNMPVMVAATAAITAERLAPKGGRAARAVGTLLVGAGVFLIAQVVR